MTDQAWLDSIYPYSLDGGRIRWSWLIESSTGQRNIMWGHECNGQWGNYWIDCASGTKHRLVNADPEHLTLEPSVACSECSLHGFVRDGVWVPA